MSRVDFIKSSIYIISYTFNERIERDRDYFFNSIILLILFLLLMVLSLILFFVILLFLSLISLNIIIIIFFFLIFLFSVRLTYNKSIESI